MLATMLRLKKDRTDLVTLGVQCVVSDLAGRVLLVRHGYRPGWHFPGGGVERAETLKDALTRELEEETGVALEAPVRLFAIYSHFDAFPGDHIALFVAGNWQRSRIPKPNREIAEAAFFARDALPDGTTLPTRRRLEEVFSGLAPAPNW